MKFVYGLSERKTEKIDVISESELCRVSHETYDLFEMHPDGTMKMYDTVKSEWINARWDK